jgi:DNA-binding transcriptional LysR family regulator
VINETAIRCFLSLADTLSFSNTAKQVYLTQQSVSKIVSNLEEDLGFRLFVRTHQHVSLTKAGEIFYDLFSKFSDEFESVSQNIREYYEGIFSTLRVGHLEWLEISDRVGGAVKQLRAERPSVKYTGERHSQYDLIELFIARKLDIIITYSEFAPKGVGINKRKLLDTPLVLLVAPDNPAVGPGATVDDFRNEPFIKAAGSHETHTASRNRAKRQCRELGFTPSEIIIAPNLESAYLATELGQGVLVSTMLSRMSLHSELVCYEIGKTEQLQCFWHEDTENPAVESFISYIERAATRESAQTKRRASDRASAAAPLDNPRLFR